MAVAVVHLSTPTALRAVGSSYHPLSGLWEYEMLVIGEDGHPG